MARFRIANPFRTPQPVLLPTPELQGAVRSYLNERRTLLSTLTRRFTSQAREDHQGWRAALAQAQHPERPDPGALYDLYHTALLDTHLAAVVRTRKIRVTGAQRTLVGAEDASRARWVDDLLAAVLDARFWGAVPIEFAVGAEGTPAVLRLPQRHLLPSHGWIRLEAHAPAPKRSEAPPKGFLALSERPELACIEDAPLGLLQAAVPLVLVKRLALASWSEFVELFGMPLRIGRTPARDPQRKQEMADVLKALGSAAYAVLEDGEDIEFQQQRQGDAFRVFDRLIERCNLELSKLVNGQTLTTEQGDRGARALGEIHDRVFDSITRADVRWAETVINTELLPQIGRLPGLERWAGVQLRINLEATQLSLHEQWQIDQGLLKHYRLDPNVLAARYGTPITAER